MAQTPQDQERLKVTLNEGESIEIIIENVMLIIEHKNTGISMDTYNCTNLKSLKHHANHCLAIWDNNSLS
tara:strand:- start:478 stop:687 length:210 start_codon:yes stop_codon:yes gene_type:complete